MFFKNCQKISPKIISLFFGVLVLCFALSFWVLAAWTEPGSPPPGGNVDTPLNTGLISQEKSSSLGATKFYDYSDSLYYVDPANSGVSAALSGKVGIGITNPDKALHVVDDTEATLILSNSSFGFESGRIRLIEGSNYQGGYIHYQGNANTLHIGVHHNSSKDIGDDVNVISIIRSNGKVGIGTINPTEELVVVGTTSVDKLCLSADTCRTTWPTGGGGGADSDWIIAGGGKMYATSTVNQIGVGVTNPVASFHVVSSDPTLFLQAPASGQTLSGRIRLLESASDGSYLLYDGNANRFHIGMSQSGIGDTDVIMIDASTKNVGIGGVPDPDSKLKVEGAIELGGSASYKITNVANPTANSDVATKGYVDAAGGGSGGTSVTMLSGEQLAASGINQATNWCRDLSAVCVAMVDESSCPGDTFTDWRLPTAQELALFLSNPNDSTYLWTRTLDSTERNWVIMKVSNGEWVRSLYSGQWQFRCVR